VVRVGIVKGALCADLVLWISRLYVYVLMLCVSGRRECSLCIMAPLNPVRVATGLLVGLALQRVQAFIPAFPATAATARRACVPSNTAGSTRCTLLFSSAAPTAETVSPGRTVPEFEQSPWVLLEGTSAIGDATGLRA
jgi:hypothetical protein